MKTQNPGLSPKERLLLDKLIAGYEIDLKNYIGISPKLRLAIKSYQAGLEVNWKELIGTNPFIREVASSVSPVVEILPPTDIVLTVLSDTEIRFDWTQAEGVDGAEIQYSLNGTDWEDDPWPGTTATDYTWTGLTAETQYWFRLRSYISEGYITSDWTETFTATTEASTSNPLIFAASGGPFAGGNTDYYLYSVNNGVTQTSGTFGLTDLSTQSMGAYKPTEEVFRVVTNADDGTNRAEWKNTYTGITSSSAWTDEGASLISDYLTSDDGMVLLKEDSGWKYYDGTTWNECTLPVSFGGFNTQNQIKKFGSRYFATTGYGAVPGIIVYSDDFGATWSEWATPPTASGSNGVLGLVVDGSILLAIQGDETGVEPDPTVYTIYVSYSVDEGATWSVAAEDFSAEVTGLGTAMISGKYGFFNPGGPPVSTLQFNSDGTITVLAEDFILTNTGVLKMNKIGTSLVALLLDMSAGFGDPTNKTYVAINDGIEWRAYQIGIDGELFDVHFAGSN